MIFMSNTLMTNLQETQVSQATHTDQRLTDLEIKATYTEDLLEQLDKIVARQQQQIDRLMRELAELQPPAGDGQVLSVRSLRDELPPHF